MKKQFFYAAMAVALMASCTSEDNLTVDPIIPDAEDKVAIKLGIDAPAVNAEVGGRGTGSVGDVAGSNNVWDSQKLFITMINRETGAVANEDETATTKKTIMAYNQFTYMAPRKSEQTTEATWGKGNIRIYKNGTYPATGEGNEDKGTIQYLYYPVQGTFDFYGWHLDDATITAGTTEQPNPAIRATAASGSTASATEISVKGITINGTQDIMGAKTAAPGNVATELQNWLYSARTARNNIDPTLKFEHKLARLNFYVKAGSFSAALYDEAGTKKTAPTAYANDPTATGAMYVDTIIAQNLHSTFDMTLNNAGITTNNAGTKTQFYLGSKLTANGVDGTPDAGKKKGQIGKLVPVAPNYCKDYSGSLAEGLTKEAKVGESILFLPVAKATGEDFGTEDKVSFRLKLKQFVQLTKDETDNTGAHDTYGYKEQWANVTVKATDVKLDGSTVTKFEAGKSYNVYITIYGFERIEVSAELTPWQLGGDVDVDIEEGESGTDNGGNDEGEEDDEEEAEDVQVTFTMPEGVTAATITVQDMAPFAWTAQNNKMTFTDGDASVTATITIEGYQPIEKTFIPNQVTTNGITVEQRELLANPSATPENVTITFTMPEGIDAALITIPGVDGTSEWTPTKTSVEVPYGEEAITATININGYATITKEFTPNANGEIEVTGDDAANAKLYTLRFNVTPYNENEVTIYVKVEGDDEFTTLEDTIYKAVKDTKITYYVRDSEGSETDPAEFIFGAEDHTITIDMNELYS